MDYEEYVRRIELALQNDMRDRNCWLSGMCADRAGSDCRHGKRFDEQKQSPSCSDLLMSPFKHSSKQHKVNVENRIFYHPFTDHNYHGENRPVSPARSDEHLGIETPSDSDDSEIDVENVSDTNLIERRYQTTQRKTPAPSVSNTRKRAATKACNIRISKQATTWKHKDESLKLTIKKLNNSTKNWNKNGNRYTVKGSRSAFAPGLTEAERNKRLDHNKMERQRRKMSLNYCYMLRDVIPCFNQRQKPKMSKVMVLTEGTKYIKELQRIEAELKQAKMTLQRRNDELKAKLKNLKDPKSRNPRGTLNSTRKSNRKQKK